MMDIRIWSIPQPNNSYRSAVRAWKASHMYVDPDYKSKKEFITAVKAGVQHRPYNPSGMFPPPENGRVVIEGPHYPKPHRWYAQCEVKDGVVISVK